MTKLRDRIQNGLDEARILVIGAQILIGFEYRIVLEPAFDRLPLAARALALVALVLILITFGCLLVPSSFHRLVERGEDTPRLYRMTQSTMGIALAPFAVALGLDVYLVGEHMFGTRFGVTAGAALTLVALAAWYGVGIGRRHGEGEVVTGKTELSDKIKHVLTEARVVLPGAQALLGFALLAAFTSSFERLPAASKVLHFCGLVLTAFATILLMMPAAYHRIVERGEDTERFHRFASRVLLVAMAVLGLGIACDFYVVVNRISGSTGGAVAASLALVILFAGLWFGYALWVRIHGRARPTLHSASSPEH
jgi:FtsH-binding integral membrane protein